MEKIFTTQKGLIYKESYNSIKMANGRNKNGQEIWKDSSQKIKYKD